MRTAAWPPDPAVNFASAPFILGFLPVTLALFHALRGPRAGEWRMVFLILASAVFYLSSGWQNGLVLAASIGGNFLAGRLMLASKPKRRKAIMWLAVLGNLALLLGFKLTILAADSPDGFTVAEDVVLPLALSFVTFQQIGFIVGVLRGTIKAFTLREYLFFVLFFPQLVLGPIIRFEDVQRQLHDGALQRVESVRIVTGLAVFCLALVKKLLLADPLGRRATQVFEAAQHGPVAMADAWYGVVTFQLQLFFDFSAYAEMSIGLAMMLGMTMPLNFDRPLFARDRADLWRRWHISFSTFMRNTVFMPLMRRWKWPAWAALALTGVLSGLWHGLGATFVLWGLLQTAILLWLHWRTTSRRHSGKVPLPAAVAIPVTFATTCLLGALFRSPDIAAAQNIYGSLAGLGSYAGITSQLTVKALAMTLTAALVVWCLPDMGQLFRDRWRFTELRAGAQPPPRHWLEPWLAFRPGGAWGCACAIAIVVALFMLLRQDQAARFIYVQF